MTPRLPSLVARVRRALETERNNRASIQKASAGLGRAVRVSRGTAGLRDIAKKLGISKSYLSDLECGHRIWTIELADKVVRIFN